MDFRLYLSDSSTEFWNFFAYLMFIPSSFVRFEKTLPRGFKFPLKQLNQHKYFLLSTETTWESCQILQKKLLFYVSRIRIIVDDKKNNTCIWKLFWASSTRQIWVGRFYRQLKPLNPAKSFTKTFLMFFFFRFKFSCISAVNMLKQVYTFLITLKISIEKN